MGLKKSWVLNKAFVATAIATATGLLTGCSAIPVAPTAVSAAASTSNAPATDPAVVGEYRVGSGYLKGYLNAAEMPDSLALLPLPPAVNSAALAADTATFHATKASRSGVRGQMAFDDNNLKFPAAASVFSCAMGLPISQEATPHINMLLRRTLVDAGLSTYKAKDHYKRIRPFATFNESTCAPKEDAALAKDGAYPSGHAALGWAWALVLAEVSPERADAILQRGHAFGQSRVICGAHWQSDVNAGRQVGSAAVAKQHANPVFAAQMTAAKQEALQIRAAMAKAGSVAVNNATNCVAEAVALKVDENK